jgi:branched-chain amino acid aminotransferase
MASAQVSAFDAGFQHGVGLFETMHAKGGRVFRLMQHLERLLASARELQLVESLRLDPLADAIDMTLERNRLKDARVRLTLTAGDMNLLAGAVRAASATRAAGGDDAPASASAAAPASLAPTSAAVPASAAAPQNDPTILIHVQPPTRYPDALFEKGVGVRVADARLNMLDAFAGHKTLWYWPRLRELQAAASVGMNEAVWFDVANGLACGCVSNVFLVKDGVVRTPTARGEEVRDAPASGAWRSPVLPGITRAAVLEIAQRLGYAVDRTRLDIGALLAADEVFLTNSSWHVLPVVRVEKSVIANGKPGPVTAAVRDALLREVAGE